MKSGLPSGLSELGSRDGRRHAVNCAAAVNGKWT